MTEVAIEFRRAFTDLDAVERKAPRDLDFVEASCESWIQ
jgi:hypothetical protein